MYSPYWVVAVAPTDGDVDAGQPLPYAWCIVLGGPPTEPGASPGTCRPPSSRHRKCNGGGLGGGLSGDGCWNQYEKLGDIFWLLLRAQEADTATLTAARAAASALGLDLSVLLPVAQAGCKYIDRGAAVVAAAPAPAPAPGSDPGPGCGGNGYGEDE